MDENALYARLAERTGIPAEQMTELLGGGAGLDPMTVAMLAMSGSPVKTEVDHETCERQLERYQEALVVLRAQAAGSDAMARFISSTFGACEECWGLNKFCPSCHGRGGPGYVHPDGEELLRWVLPALTQLGLQIQTIDALQPASPNQERAMK